MVWAVFRGLSGCGPEDYSEGGQCGRTHESWAVGLFPAGAAGLGLRLALSPQSGAQEERPKTLDVLHGRCRPEHVTSVP